MCFDSKISSQNFQFCCTVDGLLESAIDQLKSLGSKVKLEQNDQHIQSNKKAAKVSMVTMTITMA